MENKHLIIFFGQYRNFNHIVPQLNLNGFDVIASTWDMAFSGDKIGVTNNWRIPITEDDILRYIPNAVIPLDIDIKLQNEQQNYFWSHAQQWPLPFWFKYQLPIQSLGNYF